MIFALFEVFQTSQEQRVWCTTLVSQFPFLLGRKREDRLNRLVRCVCRWHGRTDALARELRIYLE